MKERKRGREWIFIPFSSFLFDDYTMRNLMFVIFLLLPFLAKSQNNIGTFTGDETMFYAQTKQVNQFFRRFNAEEDVAGTRLYAGNPGYHDLKTRRKFLNILFDKDSPLISNDLKTVFIEEVLNKKAPILLDFHGNDWFSEISATFTWKKEKVNIIFYLRIELQNGGYKWVFSNAFCDKFNTWFAHLGDTTNLRYFLHPMSHEVDFMNIHKALDDVKNIDFYLDRNYVPDHLALFVSELKEGNLKFVSVNNVKFHVFQVPNWYFEVSFFNRNSYNSGWLISNLVRLTPEDKKELMKHYTHIN